ncbi:MAG: Chondramide synthase cmdD [Nitrosomonadaceae bacterium]|nr:Chondramide synthase cmdD [Nitrosomonadaceae bacterium]
MIIPCVIGTKIATKTLKHGDLVEVDATRGIVNILERASLSTVDTGLHSEEYVYYGFWKQKLLTNSYWAYSYSQEIIDQMGLRMTVPGSLIGTGGHVLAHKDVIYAVRQQWGERIVARDQVFFEHCKEVTDRVLNDALARVDELSSASISSETFEKIDRVLNDINFIWLLGAGYFVVEAEARLQEKVIEKQVPAELVLQLIPTFKTMFTEQQDDVGMLRKLAHGKTKQEIIKDKNIMDKVDEHIQQFAWIETANFIGGPFTKESLIDLVVSLSGSDHHVTNTEYIPDEELSFHLSVMSISGYIKQICAETFSKASFMIRPFFERLAQQMEISYQDLINLSRNEIRAYLEGRLSVDVIRQTLIVREKSDYLLYRTESEDVIIENDSAARVFLGKIVPTADTNAKELTGTTGNPGKITGEVCIVLNSDDFHKFKEGNILVSTMTTPDFVVLMQKSAAIVTDIGGLLCHAAIVSRELKKPCVIGTKFATQVLKDGDLVEVDAHTGRVRML